MARAPRSRRTLLWTTAISTVIVPGGLLIGLPYALVSSGMVGARTGGGVPRVLGYTMIVGGAALLLWCTRGFVVHGDGTPNPLEPPRRLVARGPYRLVRNPMYLAMGLVIAGEALLLRSPGLLGYLAVVVAACHAFVVAYEEPTLARLFGPAYDDYRARVPRWLPRAGRRSPIS